MAVSKELSELAERKRLLLLESRMHRDLLSLEAGRLQERLDRLSGVWKQTQRLAPWVLAGSAAAGAVGGRKWAGVLRLAPKAWALWRWLRRGTT